MRRPTNTGLASLPTRHLRSLIRACTRQSSIGVGKKLQAAIITGRLSRLIPSQLPPPFPRCTGPSLLHASHFNEIPHSHKDAVDWTVFMGCFGHHGMLQSGLRLFVKMRSDDLAWFVCSMRVLGRAMLKLGSKDIISR
ncbi:hypothetical protein ACFX13_045940 [Malus domestica]